MKRKLVAFINRIAWSLVRRTTSDADLHLVVLRHSCGSERVQPMGRMLGWKSPAFQCLGCNALIPDKDITLRSVNAEDVHSQRSLAHALF